MTSSGIQLDLLVMQIFLFGAGLYGGIKVTDDIKALVSFRQRRAAAAARRG